MRWSHLQHTLHSFLADSVRPHVGFYSTRYGPGMSGLQDRAWITWDQQEIASFATSRWWRRYDSVVRQLRTINHCTNVSDPSQREDYYLAADQAQMILDQEGIFSRRAFHAALHEYLSLSIEAAVASPNPIIRAIAMFDRRLGKRRLRQFAEIDFEHPLVKHCYQLRCEAEGLLHNTVDGKRHRAV